MTPSSLGAAVLSYAVLAPVSVHYGYLMRAIFEYGYITGLFVFIITVATVMVGGWAALSAMPDSWLMANFPEWLRPWGPWLLLGLGLVGYLVSLLVSIFIYERQDH